MYIYITSKQLNCCQSGVPDWSVFDVFVSSTCFRSLAPSSVRYGYQATATVQHQREDGGG